MCGLSDGNKLSTAGWGDFKRCCRITIHKDGICIRPVWTIVANDIAYANEVYQTLTKAK